MRPPAAVMAPTPTISAELTRRGFARVRLWTRGVDHALFRPRPKPVLELPRPIFLCVGRVAVEKNLEALLDLDLPGSTVIVGDGPERRPLQRRYPRAHFLGAMQGEALAQVYASADVFVFPSPYRHVRHRADRGAGERASGRRLSGAGPARRHRPEARGSSTRICATACLAALKIPREAAREHSMRFTWRESARQFLENIEASRPSPVRSAQKRVELLGSV